MAATVSHFLWITYIRLTSIPIISPLHQLFMSYIFKDIQFFLKSNMEAVRHFVGSSESFLKQLVKMVITSEKRR